MARANKVFRLENEIYRVHLRPENPHSVEVPAGRHATETPSFTLVKLTSGGDSRPCNRTDQAKILLGDACCSGCVGEQAEIDAYLTKLILQSLAASGLKVRQFLIDDADLDLNLAWLCANGTEHGLPSGIPESYFCV